MGFFAYFKNTRFGDSMIKKSTPIKAFFALAIILFTACNDSGSSSESSPTSGCSFFDTELTGTWVQVSDLTELGVQDSFYFSSDNVRGTPFYIKYSANTKCAFNGHIFETAEFKKYLYSYKIVKDTLWLLEETTMTFFNKTWAVAYVKAGTDTEANNIAPNLYGHWKTDYTTNPAYYTIAENTFNYDKDIGDTAYHQVYADSGTLYLNRGLLAVINSSDTNLIATYKVIGDSLTLNYCSSFCWPVTQDLWFSSSMDNYLKQAE